MAGGWGPSVWRLPTWVLWWEAQSSGIPVPGSRLVHSYLLKKYSEGWGHRGEKDKIPALQELRAQQEKHQRLRQTNKQDTACCC